MFSFHVSNRLTVLVFKKLQQLVHIVNTDLQNG